MKTARSPSVLQQSEIRRDNINHSSFRKKNIVTKTSLSKKMDLIM